MGTKEARFRIESVVAPSGPGTKVVVAPGHLVPLSTTAVVRGDGWRVLVHLGANEKGVALGRCTVSPDDGTDEEPASWAGVSPSVLERIPWAAILDAVVEHVGIPQVEIVKGGQVIYQTTSDMMAAHDPKETVRRTRSDRPGRPEGSTKAYTDENLRRFAALARQANDLGVAVYPHVEVGFPCGRNKVVKLRQQAVARGFIGADELKRGRKAKR